MRSGVVIPVPAAQVVNAPEEKNSQKDLYLVQVAEAKETIGFTGTMLQHHFNDEKQASDFVEWLKKQPNLQALNIIKASVEAKKIDEAKKVYIVRVSKEQFQAVFGLNTFADIVKHEVIDHTVHQLLANRLLPSGSLESFIAYLYSETTQKILVNELNRKSFLMHDYITNMLLSRTALNYVPALLELNFNPKLLNQILLKNLNTFIDLTTKAKEDEWPRNHPLFINGNDYESLSQDTKTIVRKIFHGEEKPHLALIDTLLEIFTYEAMDKIAAERDDENQNFLHAALRNNLPIDTILKVVNGLSATVKNALLVQPNNAYGNLQYNNGTYLKCSPSCGCRSKETPLHLAILRLNEIDLIRFTSAFSADALSEAIRLANASNVVPFDLLKNKNDRILSLVIEQLNSSVTADLLQNNQLLTKGSYELGELSYEMLLKKADATRLSNMCSFRNTGVLCPTILDFIFLYQAPNSALIILSKISDAVFDFLLLPNKNPTPDSYVMKLGAHILHEPSWQTEELLTKLFKTIKQPLAQVCYEHWLHGRKLPKLLWEFAVKTDPISLPQEFLKASNLNEVKAEHILTGSKRVVSIEDVNLLNYVWDEGLATLNDFRVLRGVQHTSPELTLILDKLHYTQRIHKGFGVNLQIYKKEQPEEKVNYTHEQIANAVLAEKALIKIIKPGNWTEYFGQLKDYNVRPPLRNRIDKSQHTHKFVHLTGQIVEYKVKRKKNKIYDSTKKNSTTNLDKDLSMGVFGEHDPGRDLVGLIFNADFCKIKAYLTVDTGTYTRGWVGSLQSVMQYQAFIRSINCTSQAQFREEIKKRPYKLNEVLAKQKREAVMAQVIVIDTPRARDIAQERAKALAGIGVNVPILFYNRPRRALSRYFLKEDTLNTEFKHNPKVIGPKLESPQYLVHLANLTQSNLNKLLGTTFHFGKWNNVNAFRMFLDQDKFNGFGYLMRHGEKTAVISALSSNLPSEYCKFTNMLYSNSLFGMAITTLPISILEELVATTGFIYSADPVNRIALNAQILHALDVRNYTSLLQQFISSLSSEDVRDLLNAHVHPLKLTVNEAWPWLLAKLNDAVFKKNFSLNWVPTDFVAMLSDAKLFKSFKVITLLVAKVPNLANTLSRNFFEAWLDGANYPVPLKSTIAPHLSSRGYSVEDVATYIESDEEKVSDIKTRKSEIKLPANLLPITFGDPLKELKRAIFAEGLLNKRQFRNLKSYDSGSVYANEELQLIMKYLTDAGRLYIGIPQSIISYDEFIKNPNQFLPENLASETRSLDQLPSETFKRKAVLVTPFQLKKLAIQQTFNVYFMHKLIASGNFDNLITFLTLLPADNNLDAIWKLRNKNLNTLDLALDKFDTAQIQILLKHISKACFLELAGATPTVIISSLNNLKTFMLLGDHLSALGADASFIAKIVAQILISLTQKSPNDFAAFYLYVNDYLPQLSPKELSEFFHHLINRQTTENCLLVLNKINSACIQSLLASSERNILAAAIHGQSPAVAERFIQIADKKTFTDKMYKSIFGTAVPKLSAAAIAELLLKLPDDILAANLKDEVYRSPTTIAASYLVSEAAWQNEELINKLFNVDNFKTMLTTILVKLWRQGKPLSPFLHAKVLKENPILSTFPAEYADLKRYEPETITNVKEEKLSDLGLVCKATPDLTITHQNVAAIVWEQGVSSYLLYRRLYRLIGDNPDLRVVLDLLYNAYRVMNGFPISFDQYSMNPSSTTPRNAVYFCALNWQELSNLVDDDKTLYTKAASDKSTLQTLLALTHDYLQIDHGHAIDLGSALEVIALKHEEKVFTDFINMLTQKKVQQIFLLFPTLLAKVASAYSTQAFLLLQPLLKEAYLNALLYQDTQGNTLLHYCRNNGELINRILQSLPQQEGFKLLSIKNNLGETPLHCLSHEQKDYVLGIYALLTPEQLSELCLITSKQKTTIVDSVVSHLTADELFALMNKLSDDAWTNILFSCGMRDNFILRIVNYLLTEATWVSEQAFLQRLFADFCLQPMLLKLIEQQWLVGQAIPDQLTPFIESSLQEVNDKLHTTASRALLSHCQTSHAEEKFEGMQTSLHKPFNLTDDCVVDLIWHEGLRNWDMYRFIRSQEHGLPALSQVLDKLYLMDHVLKGCVHKRHEVECKPIKQADLHDRLSHELRLNLHDAEAKARLVALKEGLKNNANLVKYSLFGSKAKPTQAQAIIDKIEQAETSVQKLGFWVEFRKVVADDLQKIQANRTRYRTDETQAVYENSYKTLQY